MKQIVFFISSILTFGLTALVLPSVIGGIMSSDVVDDGEGMVYAFAGMILVLFVVPIVAVVFCTVPKGRKYLCISGWIAIGILHSMAFICRKNHSSEQMIRMEEKSQPVGVRQ
jgi:hypothetical protein